MFVAMVSLCTCRGSSWEMVLVRLRVGVIWMLSVADGVDHGDADKATRSGIGHVTGEDLRCQGSQAMQENRGGSLVSVKSSNARKQGRIFGVSEVKQCKNKVVRLRRERCTCIS